MSRFRGPQYPSYSLPSAISNAIIIYEKWAMSPFSRSDFAELMGYSSLNGAADKSIGTMRQFGLISLPLPGQISASILAKNIITGNQELRKQGIKDSFLNPFILKEIYNLVGANQTQADDIAQTLTNFGFSDRSFKPILVSYNKTIEFAKEENIII